MKKIFYVLVLVGAAVFYGCSGNGLTPEMDATKLWPAGEDGSEKSWGYINAKGDMVIRAKYDEANSFSCGWASVKEDGDVKYIDKGGNKGKVPSVDGYYKYFYYNRIEFRDDTLYGKFDTKFEKIVKAKYAQLGRTGDNGFCFFREEGETRLGYLDRNGNEVISDEYDYAATFAKGIAVVGEKKNDEMRYGIINPKGDYTLDPSTKVLTNLGEGRVESRNPSNGKCIMIDKNGNEYGDSYDNINPFSCALAMVVKNNKYGYIDIRGNEIIGLSFADATDFSDNVAWVREKAEPDARYILIDMKGNEIFTLNKSDRPASLYHNGLCLIYNAEKSKYTYINKKADEIYSWKFKTPSPAPARTLREMSMISMAQTENGILFMERMHGLRLNDKCEIENAD